MINDWRLFKPKAFCLINLVKYIMINPKIYTMGFMIENALISSISVLQKNIIMIKYCYHFLLPHI